MKPLIYRILDRTLAVVEVVFGAGTLFGLGLGVVAGPEQTRPLEWILGVPVMILTIVAGVLLWRGRRAGLALSLGLQLFQILPVIIAHTAVRYVAGFHWTLRFGGPRIWKPWGLEGTFIVLHDASFPTTLVGLNVVALVTVLYLATRLHATSQNSAVIQSAQLSY
ncbi:MAG TPA: hypothetical protein VJ865_13105 [Gemmatimonadaceae bacterium]|nr:hypothetical protein [Gemmatimonadaceae bacterium]